MRFRKFGPDDWQVSALGFGAMRLPSHDNRPFSGDVDERESIRMIRHAIDEGVNYVDTAYPYHDGRSEVVVGKALEDGYRHKVRLATKSPVWAIKETADFDKYLNEQLTRLHTDHIDYYLFHGLGKSRWGSFIAKLNLLKPAEAAQRDGRIGAIGFSFHGPQEEFPPIVDGFDHWAMCQIQYNYMDIENQAGVKGLKYAAAKGIPIVVMEPLMGGRLARPPASIKAIFDRFDSDHSPADWALHWVWNQPEVALLLSGMSSMEQLKQNLKAADQSGIGTLSAEELALLDEVREAYKDLVPIPCTKCGYCCPCPQGVDIPGCLGLYNDGFIYGDAGASRFMYSRFIPESAHANACTQCRECEEKCPQKIIISEWLAKVHQVLAEGKDYER